VTPLFGRTRESEQLTAFLDRTHGAARMLSVRGPAGIGKSALLDCAAAAARERGFLVLEGAAHPESGDVPFFPLRNALVRFLDSAPDQSLFDGREAPWWAAETAGVLRDAGTDEPAGSPALADESICRLFRQLSLETPVLLLLDDLQWADRSTLRLLRWMQRSLAGCDVLRIAAFRDDEGWLTPELAGLSERADSLELLPLNELDSRRLFASALPPGFQPPLDISTASIERADGNPLFLVHAARAVAEGHTEHALDDGAAGVLRARFMALPPEVRDILSAAAILGLAFDPAALAELLGRPLEGIATPLRQGIDARFIRAGDGVALRFAHPLAREVAEAHRLAGESSALHRAALGVKQRRGALPEELAVHAFRAGDFESSRDLSVGAARLAASRAAYHEAAAHYDRALASLHAVRAHAEISFVEEAARAWLAASEAARAGAAFLEAADRCQSAGDEDRESLNVARSARAAARAPTIERLTACIARAEGKPPGPPLALSLATWAHVLAGGRSTGGRAVFDASRRALTIARSSGDPEALSTALLAHGHILANAIDFQRGCELLRECLHVAEQAGFTRDEHAAAVNLVSLLTKAGDLEGAAEHARAAVHRALARGAYREAGQMLGRLAETLLARGLWADARSTAQDALLLSDDGDAQAIRTVRFALAHCFVRQQSWDQARALIALELPEGAARTFFPHGPFLGLELQRLLAEGDGAEAFANAQSLASIWTSSGEAYYGIELTEHLVLAALAVGALDTARQFIANAEKRLLWLPPDLRRLPALAIHMQHGHLANGESRYREATEHFRAAMEGFGRANLPYEEARAAHAAAVAAIETRDADLRLAARERLLLAHERFTALHSPEAARTLALLRRMRWLKGARRGPRPLTRREDEIGELLALGISNAEIANRLVLSRRTVDNHLARMFDKFDVRSRTALVQRLNQLRGVPAPKT